MTEIRPISNRRDIGLPPGTPVFTGERLVENVRINYFKFNESECIESEITSIADDFPEIDPSYITWIDVVGIHDVDLIKAIGKKLGLDPILLEDVVNTNSRPKIEDMDDYFFLLLKDLYFDIEKIELQQEQITFVVGKHFVISFQEDIGDQFETIRERIRTKKGAIRRSQTDFLFNRLLDTIVDHYFYVIEDMGIKVEELEGLVVSNPNKETLQLIQQLKSELIYARRMILPLREVVGIMTKLEEIVVSPQTHVFVRSIYDHLNQIIDGVEIYREMLTGFLEIYLSSISNKTNDVMKVLTIITSIFIPLSFLAGVYGMNFENMPELKSQYGYFILWGIFVIIASTMFYYFKKIGWLTLDN